MRKPRFGEAIFAGLLSTMGAKQAKGEEPPEPEAIVAHVDESEIEAPSFGADVGLDIDPDRVRRTREQREAIDQETESSNNRNNGNFVIRTENGGEARLVDRASGEDVVDLNTHQTIGVSTASNREGNEFFIRGENEEIIPVTLVEVHDGVVAQPQGYTVRTDRRGNFLRLDRSGDAIEYGFDFTDEE